MLLKYLCGTRQHDATFALKVQEKRRAELHCFIVKYPIAGPARGHWAGQQPALVETDIFWKLLKSTSLEYFAQKLPSWLRRLKVPERSWEHSNQSDQAQVQDRHWTGVCLIAYLGKVYFTINTMLSGIWCSTQATPCFSFILSTKATYCCLASSLDTPFLLFHASHLAQPLKGYRFWISQKWKNKNT